MHPTPAVAKNRAINDANNAVPATNLPPKYRLPTDCVFASHTFAATAPTYRLTESSSPAKCPTQYAKAQANNVRLETANHLPYTNSKAASSTPYHSLPPPHPSNAAPHDKHPIKYVAHYPKRQTYPYQLPKRAHVHLLFCWLQTPLPQRDCTNAPPPTNHSNLHRPQPLSAFCSASSLFLLRLETLSYPDNIMG